MTPLYIAGAIIVIVIAYLLLTGGWDIGENVQFIVVGALAGALIVKLIGV